MRRTWAWLLSKLQDRCRHEPRYVTADILDGDGLPQMVRWCRLCGAYQQATVSGGAAFCGLWHRPRPLWWDR